MKKIITLIAFVFCFSASSQNQGSNKIKDLKIGYINSQLDLTPEQLESFWPIYNKMYVDKKSIRAEKIVSVKKELKIKGGIENLTNEEVKKLNKKLLSIDNETMLSKKAYYKKLEEIIGLEKVLKLQLTEISFNNKLIKQLQSYEQNK